MSDELSFMTIFFRVVNFGLLVGVFYYFFNKYVKASLEEKMNQKESLIKGLEEQGYMLEGKQHELEMRLLAQERKTAQLKERIGEWRTAVENECKKEELEYATRFLAMTARISYKNEQIKQDRLAAKIASLALGYARTSLQEEFENEQRGHVFIKNLIARMENQ